MEEEKHPADSRKKSQKKGRPVKGSGPKFFVKKHQGQKKSEEQGFTGEPEQWFDGSPHLILDEAFYQKLVPGISEEEQTEKDYYFASYSHYHIHQEMINDSVRTKSYQMAIEDNPEAFKDKVGLLIDLQIVLDIGCGTGILSIFAARAGAKHVYGIDMADVALYARQIMKDNKMDDKVTIIKGKVEEVDLMRDYGVQKVDIIISEWMGYMLLYQSMLDTVLYARDRWLRPDGLILPNRVSLHLVGIEDEVYKRNKYNFWDNVYGIDMRAMKRAALSESLIDRIEVPQICTNVIQFWEADLNTVTKEDLDFSNQYTLTMVRNDNLHALSIWFDVQFDRMKKFVRFSTGPFTQYTHWQQTVLYLNEPIYHLREGDTISGSFAVRKGKKNFRELDVKFSVHCQRRDLHKKEEEQEVPQSSNLHQICLMKLR